jgi:coatomer subunit beta'
VNSSKITAGFFRKSAATLIHWISSAIFIARKEWVVAAAGDSMYVFTCPQMKEIKRLEGLHGSLTNSLAVHPSEPFLLSASNDSTIRLWNWEKKWDCIRTFTHSAGVLQAMFNPFDGSNTFASVSMDCTVKVNGYKYFV